MVASEDLADAVGAQVGDQLSAIVGDTVLLLEVVRVVPTVPSAPGQLAVLADVDALSRALIDTGQLDPVVDAWWVGNPTSGTVQALQDLELGDVTVRQDVAEQLARGPAAGRGADHAPDARRPRRRRSCSPPWRSSSEPSGSGGRQRSCGCAPGPVPPGRPTARCWSST